MPSNAIIISSCGVRGMYIIITFVPLYRIDQSGVPQMDVITALIPLFRIDPSIHIMLQVIR